jgi:hypothetical protein
MKKKLESELISIAHRILKLKGKEDVGKMHSEVSALYEKLTVLKFANENFEDDVPTIGSDSSFFEMLDGAFNNKVSDNIEFEDKVYINLDEVEDDGIMEPVMEKIKNMVAHMPEDSEKADAFMESILPKKEYYKNDLEEITAGFDKMPEFDPITEANDPKNNSKKSLNDQLKGNGLAIGLNDKLAFIKHLFEGKSEDYDRVVSQINSMNNFVDIKNLIENKVKPDYNNWDGKEEYEARFMHLIESKFE